MSGYIDKTGEPVIDISGQTSGDYETIKGVDLRPAKPRVHADAAPKFSLLGDGIPLYVERGNWSYEKHKYETYSGLNLDVVLSEGQRRRAHDSRSFRFGHIRIEL